MGDTCTRGCMFCSVKTSRKPPPLDPAEPRNTALAIHQWGLGYIVLTSVDRDERIANCGLDVFAHNIETVERLTPFNRACIERIANCGLDVFAHNIETVERLTPFNRACIERIANCGLDVFAHNIETVERLTPFNRACIELIATCGLDVFAHNIETVERLTPFNRACIERIANCGLDVFAHNIETVERLTPFPTKRHLKVFEYVTPAKFQQWETRGGELGFLYTASGPLVRSSYRAGDQVSAVEDARANLGFLNTASKALDRSSY
ncbi:Lipoic acid synthase [Operophtera brumata]|uniref:Lipoic acid synthase n=1 Tax=Operophtera brumata TaxID=104452 RepID=A0A0L7KQY5_OPEBR|nr:Lipoic acid synthase [Operophtera brumata]